MSNEIELSLSNKPPGYSVSYLYEKNQLIEKSFIDKLINGENLKYKKIPILLI